MRRAKAIAGRARKTSRRGTPGALGRCAALDMDGKRCRKDAVRMREYHGDGELYGLYGFCSDRPEPKWVHVALCADHSEPGRTLEGT